MKLTFVPLVIGKEMLARSVTPDHRIVVMCSDILARANLDDRRRSRSLFCKGGDTKARGTQLSQPPEYDFVRLVQGFVSQSLGSDAELYLVVEIKHRSSVD